jgi:N-acetylneuraminate synthase
MRIGNRNVGPGHPCYIVAELSANHGQDYDQAVALIRAMHKAGADAVKVQTYTADSLTINSRLEPFVVGGGTLWDGRTLYELYQEASMPWDWQPRLQQLAQELGLDFFSTPFDAAAVNFLEGMDVPAHKIASFELVDLPLLRQVAATGKPIIMSTGMATLEEIDEALETLRAAQTGPVALLKCTSAYPAPLDEMHLRTIPDMARRFGVPIGLSDHTPGHTAAVVAVALGACIVEKHFTLSRAQPGPDSAFSMEPDEFRALVDAIRDAEQSLGGINYTASAKEAASRALRRSLFVVLPVRAGERFTTENIRCIRPGHGLHSRHLDEVLGATAACDIAAGTPVDWSLLARPANAKAR